MLTYATYATYAYAAAYLDAGGGRRGDDANVNACLTFPGGGRAVDDKHQRRQTDLCERFS
jgi:hypothetical protein